MTDDPTTAVAADDSTRADDLVLDIAGLSVDYGTGPAAVRAVDSVDLTLRRGEFLGLAGESGSGKSTLAFGMTRLLPPPGVITAGTVHYRRYGEPPVELLGASESRLRALRWSSIAIVFQSAMNALNPVLTVGEQLTDAVRAHQPGIGRRDRQTRAAELLRLVGIPAERRRSYPFQLSGGMRQRVMIAMALALEPDIVIMDEPTTALDVVMQRQILRQIWQLRERLRFSVIFITHDLSLLLEVADTIAIMYAGHLVEQGPAASLYRHPAHPYTHGLLHSFPPLRGERRDITGIPGSPPDLAALAPGCPFSPRCRYAFDRCGQQRPLLTTAATTDHAVACWLHDPTSGAAEPPAELRHAARQRRGRPRRSVRPDMSRDDTTPVGGDIP